jgi:hypothetical protein
MIEELAQQSTAILLPFLPYLLGPTAIAAKDAAIKAMSGKFVDAAWDKAASVWENLRPHIEKNPETRESLEKLIKKDNNPAQEALVIWEFEKLLSDLSPKDLTKLKISLGKSTNHPSSSDRTIKIGRDAKDNIIIMGDGGNYKL